MGTAKCCQVPMKSMNFRSTISMFLFLANARTSFAFIGYLLGLWRGGFLPADPSDGVVSAFPRADPDDLFDVGHEDLPVADAPGARGFLHHLDHLGDQVVGDDDLQLDLGEEIHDIFRAAVQFGVALLAAEPLDLG